jgi:hypothetical protein
MNDIFLGDIADLLYLSANNYRFAAINRGGGGIPARHRESAISQYLWGHNGGDRIFTLKNKVFYAFSLIIYLAPAYKLRYTAPRFCTR